MFQLSVPAKSGTRFGHRPAALALLGLAALGLSACGGKERPRADLAASQVTTIGVNSYLWRASLDALSFMPLLQADSSGGVVITDWYANPSNPGERMKVTVSILDRDLRADALARRGVAPGFAGRDLGRCSGAGGDGTEARGNHPHARPRPAPRRLQGLISAARTSAGQARQRGNRRMTREPRFGALAADARWQKAWEAAKQATAPALPPPPGERKNTAARGAPARPRTNAALLEESSRCRRLRLDRDGWPPPTSQPSFVPFWANEVLGIWNASTFSMLEELGAAPAGRLRLKATYHDHRRALGDRPATWGSMSAILAARSVP